MQTSPSPRWAYPALAPALARRGITTPFPIQTLVLPDALAGRDVLGKSPTGSGKTLAFAIPIVERADPAAPLGALVLVPTRELAQQVVDETSAIARTRGLRVAAAYGGVSISEQARPSPRPTSWWPPRAGSRISPAEAGPPRRRADPRPRRGRPHAGHGVPARRSTASSGACRRPPDMFFSATLEGAVGAAGRAIHAQGRASRDRRRARRRWTRPSTASSGRRGTARSTRSSTCCSEDRRTGPGVRPHQARGRPARRAAAGRGLTAAAMHGDLSQAAAGTYPGPVPSGKINTLVATDVAARGLDVEGIDARRQLRPALGRQGVRAPRGPHRTGRRHGDRGHTGHARAAGRRQPHGRQGRRHRRVLAHRQATRQRARPRPLADASAPAPRLPRPRHQVAARPERAAARDCAQGGPRSIEHLGLIRADRASA